MADTCAARPLDLPEAQAQADTTTVALLASESGAETERARRVLPVARRSVEDYAPAHLLN